MDEDSHSIVVRIVEVVKIAIAFKIVIDALDYIQCVCTVSYFAYFCHGLQCPPHGSACGVD